ncbi:unnamed protein product [Cochlearia groenlandica]
MALSKLQFVFILVICSLLVTPQSKGVVREEDNPPSACVFKGPCSSNKDCVRQCGPPLITIGTCLPNPRGHGNICCCTKD